MSNVKRMDIWTAVRTVLEKNPAIKAKELIAKVREKTDLSRSTIYEHLQSFELQSRIYREKGRYWLEKPEKIDSEISVKDKIRLLELATKLADTKTPLTVRDVYLKVGKYKVKVQHE